MENKKVKNAKACEYSGIKFKSKLEVTVYKTLLEHGFEPQYEPYKYILWSGFKPTVPYYTLNTNKKQVLNSNKLINITFTPDFYVEYKGLKVIVDVKGFANDLFPYKFKMFRKYIEEQPDKEKYLIFEIYSKKQLLEAITIIKNYAEKYS